MTILLFGALCVRSTFTPTDARATVFRLWFCLEGLVVVEEVPSRALGLCLLLLEMS